MIVQLSRKFSRSMTSQSGLTYKDCDVDIDEGDRLVNDFIVEEAKKTDRTGLLHGVGGFGGLFDLAQLDYKNPVIVSGTDGVGTKLLVRTVHTCVLCRFFLIFKNDLS